MIERTCKQCDGHYFVDKYRVNDSKFCSRKCYYKWMSVNTSGKNNNAWKGKVFKNCLNCNKIIKTYKCLKDRKNFCSKECQISYYIGDRHYSYSGGWKKLVRFRDNCKYRKFKKLIYERDNYTCQICGSSNHNIHHIYPIRDFIEMAYDEDNVITLCVSCHNKYEGVEYIGLFNIIKEYNDKDNSTE